MKFSRTYKRVNAGFVDDVLLEIEIINISEGECAATVDIIKGEGVDSHRVFGVDEIQALYLAMVRAGTLLYSAELYGENIYWFDPGDSLGLPCAEAMDELRKARGG